MDSDVITPLTIEKYCEMCFERGQDEPFNGNLTSLEGAGKMNLKSDLDKVGTTVNKEQHV